MRAHWCPLVDGPCADHPRTQPGCAHQVFPPQVTFGHGREHSLWPLVTPLQAAERFLDPILSKRGRRRAARARAVLAYRWDLGFRGASQAGTGEGTVLGAWGRAVSE